VAESRLKNLTATVGIIVLIVAKGKQKIEEKMILFLDFELFIGG